MVLTHMLSVGWSSNFWRSASFLEVQNIKIHYYLLLFNNNNDDWMIVVVVVII